MAKTYYTLVAFMLGFLGFGCGKSVDPVVEYGPPPPDYGPVPEYGVPVATYVLSGQVVKAQDQAALEGIEVVFQDKAVITDNVGNWTLNLDTYNTCGHSGFPTCSLYIDDIDGPLNGGEFEPTVVALQLIQTEDGGTFYYGKFEQHSILVELDESGK